MMKRAQCAMVDQGAVLWRNNVGLFLQGKQTTIKESGMHKVLAGDVILSRPRRVKCGLDNGSSDLIGLTPVVVTQAMVGRTLAVFTSTEAKDDGKEPEPDQWDWIKMVNDNGGIGFAFHDENEACKLLAGHIQRITT